MVTKKPAKKISEKAADKKAPAKKSPSAKKPAADAHRMAVVKPAPAPAARPAPVQPPAPRRAAGPTARTCPLVLDGEIDALDFSPSDCLTCSEFDCKYCEAEAGSGALRSRLFAGSDGGDEGEDGGEWGGDFGFEDENESPGEEEEGDEQDPF